MFSVCVCVFMSECMCAIKKNENIYLCVVCIFNISAKKLNYFSILKIKKKVDFY